MDCAQERWFTKKIGVVCSSFFLLKFIGHLLDIPGVYRTFPLYPISTSSTNLMRVLFFIIVQFVQLICNSNKQILRRQFGTLRFNILILKIIGFISNPFSRRIGAFLFFKEFIKIAKYDLHVLILIIKLVLDLFDFQPDICIVC